MIVHTQRIPYNSFNDIIKLKPIADIHFGHRACDVKEFQRFLEDGDDEFTYFVGLGDLLDAIIIQDRRYRKVTDATEGEAIIDEQIDMCYDMLSPYRDRIIGLGDGNHERVLTLKCGTNPIERLCDKLGCEYLGYSWLLRLLLTKGGHSGRQVVVRGHHGWGGGSRTQGADLTKYAKDLQYWQADIFLYGHVHRCQSDKVPRIGLVGNRMVSKPKHLGICGTFQKTYTNVPASTWSEEKGYPPVEVGSLVVNIKPSSKKWCKIWIEA
jgi:hypothetical protein